MLEIDAMMSRSIGLRSRRAVGLCLLTASALLSVLGTPAMAQEAAGDQSEGACPVISDKEVRPMPAIDRPGYLEPMTDPTFGTTVVRITDPGQPIQNPTGHPSLEGLKWDPDVARHRYSSFSAWNADGSLISMSKGVQGQVFLDGNTFQPVFQADTPGDTRWHPTEPDLMIYLDENDVGFWNSRSNEKERIFTIPGYANFQWGRSSGAKGKPTYDGTKAMLIADRAYDLKNVAFVFDFETGEKGDDIDFRQYATEGDNVGIYLSPLGRYYEIFGAIKGHHDERGTARIVFDIEGNEKWRELGYHIPGHWDYDVDEHGEEWLIGLAKAGEHKGKIIRRSFESGEIELLMDGGASHTSKRNIDRSSRVALMSRIRKGLYKNEIVGVRLDGSKTVERYVHEHVVKNGYYTEPHASFSPDGHKFVFASNWDERDGAIASYVVILPQTCAQSS